MTRKLVYLTFLVLLLLPIPTHSHPWGGLVIDNNGNIYFSFICPIVDDHHYACLMKIDENGELVEVLKANRSPSDIVLTRTSSRSIYAAMRSGQNPNYLNQLWAIYESRNEKILESRGSDDFHIQAFVVSENGELTYSIEGEIIHSQTRRELIADAEFNYIQLMTPGPNNSIYFIADYNLYRFEDSEVHIIATDLRDNSPENLPFRGANILFDMVVDEANNVYVAYYGNREVFKITAEGNKSTIYESTEPFSPHGIDYYNGEIYILESSIGDGKWWEFWDREDELIVPRIIKIDSNHSETEIFSYNPSEN